MPFTQITCVFLHPWTSPSNLWGLCSQSPWAQRLSHHRHWGRSHRNSAGGHPAWLVPPRCGSASTPEVSWVVGGSGVCHGRKVVLIDDLSTNLMVVPYWNTRQCSYPQIDRTVTSYKTGLKLWWSVLFGIFLGVRSFWIPVSPIPNVRMHHGTIWWSSAPWMSWRYLDRKITFSKDTEAWYDTLLVLESIRRLTPLLGWSLK